MASVTINTKAADGGRRTLTIEKTGSSAGRVRLLGWKAGAKDDAPPSEDRAYDLFDISVTADGRRVSCKVKGFLFINPAATITATPAGGGQPAKVRLEVGSPANIGRDQAVNDSDYIAATSFLAGAGFPRLD